LKRDEYSLLDIPDMKGNGGLMTPHTGNFSEDPFKQLKDRIRLRLKEDGVDEKIVELM
jgi:hypothetical protein